MELVHGGGADLRFLGYLGNLSTTGAFVQSLSPRAPGTRLSLRIHLPTPAHPVVPCVGEVVWIRRRVIARDRSPGMGIRFVEIPPSGLELIARLCQEPAD